MKNFDQDTVNQIISELKSISEQLKKMDFEHGSTEKDFYRDSFDFMVDQNIETFEMLRQVIKERSEMMKSIA
jgi:hypothetical protein